MLDGSCAKFYCRKEQSNGVAAIEGFGLKGGMLIRSSGKQTIIWRQKYKKLTGVMPLKDSEEGARVGNEGLEIMTQI